MDHYTGTTNHWRENIRNLILILPLGSFARIMRVRIIPKSTGKEYLKAIHNLPSTSFQVSLAVCSVFEIRLSFSKSKRPLAHPESQTVLSVVHYVKIQDSFQPFQCSHWALYDHSEQCNNTDRTIIRMKDIYTQNKKCQYAEESVNEMNIEKSGLVIGTRISLAYNWTQ